MATATATFHAWDELEARNRVFHGPTDDKPGDEVPDHIAAKVGAHVVDEVPTIVNPPEGGDPDAFDEAVAQAVETQLADKLEAARQDGREEQRDRELAAYDAVVSGDEFDPSVDGVKAPQVREYLEALDVTTAAGSAEYDRVVAAEKAGGNRSTALPAQPSPTGE